MGERQVLVTGIGMISSLGVGAEATWTGLKAGRTGSGPMDNEAARAVGAVASAEVPGFRANKLITNRKSLKLMTRPVSMGVAAASMAYADAGLVEGQVDPERLGVFVGAGQAFADRSELEYALDHCRGEGQEVNMEAFGREGLPMIHPLWLLRGLSNNVLGFVSLEHNAQGINNNYANSGVSATQAIAMAATAIAEGLADVAFAGGYDSALQPECVVGYGRLGLLAHGGVDPAQAHRPFDRGRSGLVPSEGACFLILEAADHAQARGRAGLAAVSGGAVASDAFAVSDPDPESVKLRRATLLALAEAGLSPDDIGAIFAHGAASLRYDQVEINAYRALFGERLSQMPLTADKAALGHTLAACGAMSAAVAAMSLRDGLIPPIATLDEVDPACLGPRYVTGAPLEARPDHALVASAGLGGQAAALIMSRPG